MFNVRLDHDNSALSLRWFHFEKVVEALVEEGETWMKLDELSTVIKQVCHIEDEKELRTMLNFYHDLGVIVKHGHTVVLQAQWLINLFKQLITVPPFQEVVSKSYCFIIKLIAVVSQCCGTTTQKLTSIGFRNTRKNPNNCVSVISPGQMSRIFSEPRSAQILIGRD